MCVCVCVCGNYKAAFKFRVIEYILDICTKRFSRFHHGKFVVALGRRDGGGMIERFQCMERLWSNIQNLHYPCAMYIHILSVLYILLGVLYLGLVIDSVNLALELVSPNTYGRRVISRHYND